MEFLTKTAGLLGGLVVLLLIVAAIVMPLVVIMIDSKLAKILKLLQRDKPNEAPKLRPPPQRPR